MATTLVCGNGFTYPLSIQGTIYYLALYSAALSETQISTNIARLQSSDDTAP